MNVYIIFNFFDPLLNKLVRKSIVYVNFDTIIQNFSLFLILAPLFTLSSKLSLGKKFQRIIEREPTNKIKSAFTYSQFFFYKRENNLFLKSHIFYMILGL